MNKLPEYIIERVFDAPRDMVWQVWTDPKLVSRWYGPNIETTLHKFDLEPGGLWLNEMKWGENSSFQKMEFQEISKPEKLVWHHYSTDADWNIAANPMMPDWPRALLTEVTFVETGGKTTVRLSQIPMDASEAEISCFTEMMAGMDNGWGAGYKIIDDIITELQS